MHKSRLIATIIFLLILVIGALFFFQHVWKIKTPSQEYSPKNIQSQNINLNQSKNMKISSPAFGENADIPARYTCDGESINPPLAISGVPAEAKSLALILDDPDAPVPGGFVHWIVFNFDPKTAGIDENSVPDNAVQGQNGLGQSRYTGPCPPSGTHRYFFKLFALDSQLSLDSSAKREDVEASIEGHTIDQAELVGLYKRP